ncbi:hypothetical protein, partial [uncultured Porphyromonas sp.]|uniref:hypothetical protein n=1 Tax=uncultured Porphyromonas sp. TaxID=159274 RepID=UPI002609C970
KLNLVVLSQLVGFFNNLKEMPPPGASRHECIVAVHLLDICVMLSLSHQLLQGLELVWIYCTAKLYLFAKGSPPQIYPVVGTAR